MGYDKLDEILSVYALDAIVAGPNDFAMSLGHSVEPNHSEL